MATKAPIRPRSLRGILASDLPRQEKLVLLRELERDLMARSVATEEGMGGARTTALADVRAARRRLRDPLLDHPTATKYGS